MENLPVNPLFCEKPNIEREHEKAIHELRRLRFLLKWHTLAFILPVILYFAIATFSSPWRIMIPEGSRRYLERKSWWGLKTERRSLQISDDHWYMWDPDQKQWEVLFRADLPPSAR